MGVDIFLKDDEMHIEGGMMLKAASVHSHHDHRIAMACTVAALKAKGSTIIHDAQAVNKSYPSFYNNMQMLNTSLQIS